MSTGSIGSIGVRCKGANLSTASELFFLYTSLNYYRSIYLFSAVLAVSDSFWKGSKAHKSVVGAVYSHSVVVRFTSVSAYVSMFA